MSSKLTDELFEELYRDYYRAIVAYFLRRGFSRDEARDLAQKTFLRVYEKRGGYRGESKWHWMLKIAENLGKNEIRARHALKRDVNLTSLDEASSLPHLQMLELTPGGPPPSQLEEVLENELTQMLLQAIQDLEPEDRRYLEFWLAGHKYREIVKLTRSSMDAVKSRISRAKKKLKEKLSDEGIDWLNKKEQENG